MIDPARATDVVWQVENYGRSFSAISLVCGSQMAKTELLLDVIGQTIYERPAPVLAVGPNEDWVTGEFGGRLSEMLQTTKCLRERLPSKRQRANRKVVGGVPITLSSAASPAQIRGTPAKLAVIDELDAAVENVGKNGDPFDLLESRGFTYPDAMRIATSTPLLGSVETDECAETGLIFWKVMPAEDVHSPIWANFQNGTRHHFAWPCPDCGEFFIPRSAQLRFDEEGSPLQAARDAYVECPCCSAKVHEHHKPDLNARGRYVAPGQRVSKKGLVEGDLPESNMLSYWVSGLCSPFVTIGERAASFVEKKQTGRPSKIQTVVNTGFGECYMPGLGDVPEWHEVKALIRPYAKMSVPDGARFLTLAADVQKDRIYYVVRAWGYRSTSWKITHGECLGPTTHDDVWDQLAAVLTDDYDGFAIRAAFVDSGYRPGKKFTFPENKVYAFCRRFKSRAFPTKGRATMDKPLVKSKPDVTRKGDVSKYGLSLIWLNTDHWKLWLHERIRWQGEKPGAWHLNDGTDDDFCKQIVSEARIINDKGRPEWVVRSRNNHYWDCEAMGAALAFMMGAERLTRPAEKSTSQAPVADEPSASSSRVQGILSQLKRAAPSAEKSARQPRKTTKAARPVPIDARAERRARLREKLRQFAGA